MERRRGVAAHHDCQIGETGHLVVVHVDQLVVAARGGLGVGDLDVGVGEGDLRRQGQRQLVAQDDRAAAQRDRRLRGPSRLLDAEGAGGQARRRAQVLIERDRQAGRHDRGRNRVERMVVGVDLVVVRVHGPHGQAVRPDALEFAVAGSGQSPVVLARIAALVRHLVGVDLPVGRVRHPHRDAVRPDAPGIGVAVVNAVQRVELLARVALPVGHLVGVDLLVERVRHPHGDAVRPDALGRAVAGGFQRVELLA